MFITPTSSHKNRLGFALALVLALLAGGHWLGALCYSRGYDFFLWLYNAWLLSGGGAGIWPDWSPFSAAGQPAFKMAGFVDAAVLALFSEGIGIEVGTRIYVALLYMVAGGGMYALARTLSRSVVGGVVASAAYSFSWFLTYTAHYQAYLSNFLSYALMPWCALLFLRAICRASRGALLASAIMLFVSVTSNAQVAVKVMLFVVPLSYVVAVRTGVAPLRRWLLYSVLFGLFAAWWSSFLIAPALMLRQEVLLLGEVRGNAFIAPWLVLFWIPLYGVNFLSYLLFDFVFLGRDFLAWAVFSDYIGLSTLGIAIASIGFYRTSRDKGVAGLWGLLGGYYLIYFALVPNLAASAWVGRTHNWAVLPTLVLALLAAFGVRQIAQRVAGLVSQVVVTGVLCALIVVDLGGVSFFLNRLALTHLPLEDLPEVALWKQLRANDDHWDEGTRYFTYNPDLTFSLLPVLMQKPVANIIELRTRNRAYDSYISHQLRSMQSLDPTYNAAESLALLDVEYVDLARKLYDYRGDARDFDRGLTHLRTDAELELLIERERVPADKSYDAYSEDLDLEAIVGAGDEDKVLSQAVFRNHRRFWGFVPEKTLLVLGPVNKGQAFFEQVTHLPGYRADRLLFILAESWAELDIEMQARLSACILVGQGQPPEGVDDWKMNDVQRFYSRARTDKANGAARLLREAERAVYRIEGNERGSFFFLSQQRFRDWHAYGGGLELPVAMAQAGLTALYLPAGVDQVEFRYERPLYEQFARGFSLLGFLVAMAWWIAGRRWPNSCGAGSPLFMEHTTNGTSKTDGKATELVGR